MKSNRGTLRKRNVPAAVIRIAVLIVLVCQPAVALVVIRAGCAWPTNWPKALSEVGSSCTTYECATGTRENVYEIVFDDRDKFERLWPALLALRTPGSPLRVSPIRKASEGRLFKSAKPTVRIWGPSEGVTIAVSEAENQPWDSEKLLEEGKALRGSPPWPPEIVSATGELPEYVQAVDEDGCLRWVPGRRGRPESGSLHRARVELELVVDGEIIDLNRIQFPGDATIIDRRFDRYEGP